MKEMARDVRISEISPLRSPDQLSFQLPLTEEDRERIASYRDQVNRIISGEDRRLLAIVGPCSIHDPKAAIEYAEKLKKLSDELSDQFLVVMRTYFEKPRTALGWKGLIIDPDMDGTYDMDKGLEVCRKLLLDITHIGLPVGCECLDPIVPQYTDELMSWSSIGARTTESQTHDFTAAINAVKSAREPAAFIGIRRNGVIAQYHTTGNSFAHIILRGGVNGANYYENDVESAEKAMTKAGLDPSIVIDCSHANSNKDFTRQKRVLRSVVDQKVWGNTSIKGFMLESNLFEGNQSIPCNLKDLKYGVSVTDACIGWEETERIMRHAADILRKAKEHGGEEIL